jgi:hypothetical protein
VFAHLARIHQYQRPKGITINPPTLGGKAPAAGKKERRVKLCKKVEPVVVFFNAW